MRIIHVVHFDREEIEVFKACRRWLSFGDRIEWTEETYKHLSRIINDPSFLKRERITESIAAWKRVLRIAKEQEAEWVKHLESGLPENDPGSIIAKPKLAAETLLQAARDAQRDIDRLLDVLGIAEENMSAGDRLSPYETEDARGIEGPEDVRVLK